MPLFKNTGTAVRMRSLRISEQGMTQPRPSMSASTGAGSQAMEIIVIMARFLVMPILAPPGVSFVQKKPY